MASALKSNRIQQAAAEMLISHALQQESGLSRAHWLRQALEITRGRRWALSTEAHILGEIQLIDPDSYDWQEHTFEIRVPAEIAEEFIESIVGGIASRGHLNASPLLVGHRSATRGRRSAWSMNAHNSLSL